METITRRPYYSVFALILGVWFALTSWIWVYYVNIIISFPAAMLGIYLWSKGKKIGEHSILNKAALTVHIIGFSIAIISLLLLLLAN